MWLMIGVLRMSLRPEAISPRDAEERDHPAHIRPEGFPVSIQGVTHADCGHYQCRESEEFLCASGIAWDQDREAAISSPHSTAAARGRGAERGASVGQ